MYVRVRKSGFMANLLLRLNLDPNVVFETLELHISSVRPCRRVRPVAAVVAVVIPCPSVRPVVCPVVVVRPLSVRPVVSRRRWRRPLFVRPSRRRRPSSVRLSWSLS